METRSTHRILSRSVPFESLLRAPLKFALEIALRQNRSTKPYTFLGRQTDESAKNGGRQSLHRKANIQAAFSNFFHNFDLIILDFFGAFVRLPDANEPLDDAA